MRLTQAKKGKYRVIEFKCGRLATQRLCDLGITIGDMIEVVHNTNFLPLQLCVRGATLAIGRGLAEKVIIE